MNHENTVKNRLTHMKLKSNDQISNQIDNEMHRLGLTG